MRSLGVQLTKRVRNVQHKARIVSIAHALMLNGLIVEPHRSLFDRPGSLPMMRTVHIGAKGRIEVAVVSTRTESCVEMVK